MVDREIQVQRTFSDFDVALEVRDIISKMATTEINRLRPRSTMAIVVSIDRVGRKCEVQFPGDTTTVWVKMGSVQPSVVGQTVRIGGVAQDRYIEDVIGEPWIEGLVEDLGAEVADKIKTHYAVSTAPPTATAVGDLWVVTDLGALYRWNGSAWVDTGLASSIQVKSRGVDLITNGTGWMQNNTNFPTLTFDGLDYPAGVVGSFVTPTTAGMTAHAVDRIPYNPAIKYRFGFQARQTVAGSQGRLYGMIVPYDRMGNIIEPKHYMYITGTMTTLAAPLSNGQTTITLTSSANWYGSAGNPAGANTFLRLIQFWGYVDPLGKTWPSGSYTRNVSSTNAWADGGISGNVITLAAPWGGGSYPAGTVVSNGTSGGNYVYLPSATNVIVPETWTQYADTLDKGIMLSSAQEVPVSGAATFAVGMPPATAQLGVGWLLNQSVATGKHAIAAITMSEAAAANQTNVDQATVISDIQSDLTGVTGQLDGKSTIYVQTTAPTGLDAQDQGDIWINTSTTDRIPSVWDGDSWELITDATSIQALAEVQTKITTFYQNEPPTAETPGDLWIDTNDDMKLYRWNATDLGTAARTNLMANPSIETNTTGFTLSSVTIVREQVGANFQPQGTWSLRTVPTGATNDCYVSIAPAGGWGPLVGQQVTVSAWVYTGTAMGGTPHTRARCITSFSRVAAEGYTATISTPGTNGPVVGGERVSITFTVLGTDTLLRLYNGSDTASQRWVHWDGILIEQTNELRPYFDGSTASCAWTGTAHASSSTYSPAWVNVADARIANMATTLVSVQNDLTGLSGQVDGKSTVYVQDTQPHDSNLATDIGDVWIDTANGRIIKTYDGSNWNVSDDTRLALALSTANSKITTYYSSTAPTGTLVEGDLWVKTGTNLIYRYDLDTTTWEPLKVTAGSLSPELSGMAGQKLYDTFSDSSAWTEIGAGSYTVVQTSAAETGGYVFQGTGGEIVLVRDGVNGQLIPFDPNVLYRVTWRVRQTVNPSSGGSLVYLGLIGYAADGVTKVNTSGANLFTSQHYVAAAADQIVVADGWKTFTGFVKGRSTSGTTTERPSPINPGVMHNNVRYIRPIGYANMAAGNGTVQFDLVTVEVVEVGSVAGDNLQVGSISPEKIAMWAFNKNLVPDPSFEELYTFLPNTDPTSKHQWRTDWVVGNGYAERYKLPRSGERAGRLGVTGSGSNSAALYCGNFPVTPGNIYNVQINVGKEHSNVAANFYARVGGGSTDALTEYPGAPFTSVIPWNGDVPDFAANLDVAWIGQNQYPNPLMLDEDANNIHEPATAYTSGTVTTGARSVTVLSGEYFKQNISAASMAVSSRWGTMTSMKGLEKNRSYKIEFDYTLSGTNARLRLYVDTYNEDGTIQQNGLGVTVSAASGRISYTVPAHANVVEQRIYVWLEPAAGLTATSPAASWSKPLHFKVDGSGLIDPDTPNYETISGSFTAPAGVTRASLHLMINQPSGAQSIFLDDISVLEAGQGGSELTAAGIRLFAKSGKEIAAFVANRKNFFSINNDEGETIASIDSDGGGAFRTLSVRGHDDDGDLVVDSGFEVYGTEFIEWMRNLPQGLVARGEDTGSQLTWSTSEGVFHELEANVVRGRSYKITLRGNAMNDTAGGRFLVCLRYTDDGTTPEITSTKLQDYRSPYNNATASAILPFHITKVWGLPADGISTFYGEPITLRVAGTIAPEGSGWVKQYGSSTAPMEMLIEDVGRYVPESGVDRTVLSGGTRKVSKELIVENTGWAHYRGSGARNTSALDVKQGYSSTYGDSSGIWVFPSITTDIANSTVQDLRFYLYATDWVYPSGGTARIKLHEQTTVPGTVPTLHTVGDSFNWPRGAGRWVTIPNITLTVATVSATVYNHFIAGRLRGVGVGPAGSTSMGYSGSFRPTGAKLQIKYLK